MKRLLLLFLMTIFSFTAASAENWDSAAALKRVNTIGNNILKSNGMTHKINFKVSNEDEVNAYADLNKEVYVYKGLLNAVTNDEELASVIAHEVGHILNSHVAKGVVLGTGIQSVSNIAATVVEYQTGASFLAAVGNNVTQTLTNAKLSKHYEFEADITGVDLMKNAGYNPLAAISMLHNLSGDYVDILTDHPTTKRRLIHVYNYIEYNYPEYIAKGFNTESYKEAMKEISPTVEKRKNSKWRTRKYKIDQKKLLTNKRKRLEKLSKTTNGWEGCMQFLLGTEQ